MHYLDGKDFRDHPRMRGEKGPEELVALTNEGSPPHARGKELRLIAKFHIIGITPACAGKSICVTNCRVTNWDHPRMRGEKQKQGKYAEECMGSPPHARGKEPPFLSDFRTFGITPACAGKSRSI